MTFLLAQRIQGQVFARPLLVLLDSGSDITWISKKALPKDIQGYTVPKLSGTTLAGTFSSTEQVSMEGSGLPEFYGNRSLPKLGARVFHAPCRYDMIVGRDVLRSFGIKLDFEDNLMQCSDVVVPMRPFPDAPTSGEPNPAEQMMYDLFDQQLLDNDEDFSSDTPTDGFASEIKDSTYEQHSPAEIAARAKHLNDSQKQDLAALLSKYSLLFDGKLKAYTGDKIHLEVDDSAKPHVSRPYAVPRVHMPTFKKELDRLISIGVLEPCGRAEWVAGTFIIPKKDGKVRWVSDFRGLNKGLKRRYFPLPKISDILKRRKGYKFLTKLDISMQYYTFVLDDKSSDLCTIATPFGLFRYKRLPMGVAPAPDIAQELMEAALRDLLDDIEIYIDDIAIFSDDWESHVKLLDTVLFRLQEKGFTINPLKCEWGIQETDFLGHWITPTGIKPWSKKVDSILKMQPPTNIKELRSFLGLVTYYRDMWPRRSHVLAPLTDLLRKKLFHWEQPQQRAFDEMKALVAADTLLHYPDHNLPFHIETDASDYQLGAVIKQNGKPVAFYTRKLNSAQKNYTTIEKELLSIVETLREFRSMLLGAKLFVYTDHKNLTHKLTAFTTQRVLRWRIILEEYGPTFHYKKGSENAVADALSRTPTSRTEAPRYPAVAVSSPRSLGAENDVITHNYYSEDSDLVDDLLADCYMAMPKFDERGRHPFHFATIAHYQNMDASVQSLLQTQPNQYFKQQLGDQELVCRRTSDAGFQIVMSDDMLPRLVKWYHAITIHSEGADRLETTIRRHFFHPKLRDEVRSQLQQCQTCATMKKGGSGTHGELAPRDVPMIPWSEVHLDCIGPWKIKLKGVNIEINALTMIDPVTNLIEICRRHTKYCEETTNLFRNQWLSRYPRPERAVHDNGTEFTGHQFEFLLADAGISKSRITPHTPTANSIIESVHKAIGQIIRTLIHANPPTTKEQVDAVVEKALATAMHACRCASNSSLQGYSAGALVFQRDMHLNIPVIADILTISERRQIKTNQRLLQANAKRKRHEYKVNDLVYVSNHFTAADKLKEAFQGPFKILQVHTNATVTIERGLIHERISIRRLKPA